MREEKKLLGHVNERGERRENEMFYNLIIYRETVFPYTLKNTVNVL